MRVWGTGRARMPEAGRAVETGSVISDRDGMTHFISNICEWVSLREWLTYSDATRLQRKTDEESLTVSVLIVI